MKYLSVCSGIEAATVAWHPLGWTASAFAEIEAFPSAVLWHHYPDVPNFGDMTRFKDWPDATLDVLVGGTPCQSFSVAGLRAGLADPRGNLALVYLALLDRYRPRWCVWENVPGVLSSDGGRDFGALLGGLGQLGYGWSYRVLDAQYFGVAQRRRRVFVVGCLGSWQRAAAVLFERDCLLGYPPPCRETGARIADGALSRALSRVGGGDDPGANKGAPLIPELVGALSDGAHMGGGLNGQDTYSGRLFPVAHSLRADGFDASEDGTGRGTPLIAFSVKDHGGDAGEQCPTMRCGGKGGGAVMPAIAFNWQPGGATALGMGLEGVPPLRSEQTLAMFFQDDVSIKTAEDLSGSLRRDPGGAGACVAQAMAVRRLTPRECERLQGFPDDYTLVPYRGKPAADGPRYKALGNSMAVPVMAWIGRRLQAVHEIP